MRKNGVSGQATVDFIVDSAGNVRNAVAASSTDTAFAQAAVDAVSQWSFNPGLKSGRSVNTHMQVPVVFTLGNGQAAGPAAASNSQPGTVSMVPLSVPAAPTDWFPGSKG